MAAITINFNERVVAWVFIALSAITPIAASLLFSLNSIDVARSLGELAVYILFGVGLGDLFTKNRTEIVKARARLLVGILLLGYSIFHTYHLYHEVQEVKVAASNLVSIIEGEQPNSIDNAPVVSDTKSDLASFLYGMQPILKGFTDKSVALNNKINAIPIDTVLAPDNLLSQEQIVLSRGKLAEAKKLIIERGQNLTNYHDDVLNYYKTAKVNETTRRGALDSFLSGKSEVVRVNKELDNSQLAIIDEVSAILDLAERNMGRLVVGNNQLLFDNQESLDEYNLRLKNLAELAEREALASQAILRLGKSNVTQIKQDINDLEN